jgi:hypothetical protein
LKNARECFDRWQPEVAHNVFVDLACQMDSRRQLREARSVKKRALLFLLLAAGAVGTCKQGQAKASERDMSKSGPRAMLAAASESPEAATQPVTVEVQASSSVVLPGQKVLLAARITGTANRTVEWSLKEGEAAGFISLSPEYPDAAHRGPLWVYTASNTPGTYHVVAKANGGRQHSVAMALVVQPFVTGCAARSDQVGVWQNITPPQVDLTKGDFFGMQAMVVDPVNPSTIYAGRAMDGIYKSTDCGANWKKVSTGRNSHAMASGRSWTMAIDPSNPQTIYTNQGYGTGGVFKTTNGGVDWDQVLTPNITVLPYGGFVYAISMDPNDPRHLLVGWHAECPPPRTKFCFAETTDGGASWVLRDGNPFWAGGEGGLIDFLDSKSWIFASQSNGLWVSRDKGASWHKILGISISHGRGQLYRSIDGSFYLGTANGILHSIDGLSWTALPESQNLIMGLIGDGKTLYASKAFPYNVPGADPYPPYYSSPEAPPYRWTLMQSPIMRNGGAELHLDRIHHILYSTNMDAGLWRLVTQ